MTAEHPPAQLPSDDVFRGYLSDISDSDADLEDEDINPNNPEHQESVDNPLDNPEPSFHIRAPPPLKRRRLDVPVHVTR